MAKVSPSISSMELWRLVDDTFSLMNPELNHHHQMVGLLAFRIAAAAGLSEMLQHTTLQAAYLHDIGALMGNSPTSTLADIEAAGYHAAQISASLLEDFPGFLSLAGIIRHCQTPYRKNRLLPRSFPFRKVKNAGQSEAGPFGKPVLLSPAQCLEISDIIHLADEVSLLIVPSQPVLNQVQGIMTMVRASTGDEFSPQAAGALDSIQDQEKIWLDLAYHPDIILAESVQEQTVGTEFALMISRIISMIIDFRSPFTAMHSAGVATAASALGQFAGMDRDTCLRLEIAGNLHDLGKIRTPKDILEKNGKLTDAEFNVIKEHAYFTDVLLSRIRGFEEISSWAALHHEKLDGTGYPYHLQGDAIPLGAKIMAVADIFSAISEDRPYRKSLPAEKVIAILRENAAQGALSGFLVELLIQHYDEIDSIRARASKEAGSRYYASMSSEEN